MKKILSFIVILTLTLSFTAFASEFKIESSSVANNASAVSVTDNVISLTFSEAVKYSSAEATPITKNGVAMESAEYSILLSDSRTVEITFTALEYGATYVIDYSLYESNITPDTFVVDNPATLTFTVEQQPDLLVSTPTIISGIETGIITNPSNVTANTLQGWSMNVTNNDSSDKEITVVCALYDENGLLKKMVTSNKTVLTEKTDTIGIGTFIPSVTDKDVPYTGGKAKIFVWDNMTNKNPYVAAFSYDIQ